MGTPPASSKSIAPEEERDAASMEVEAQSAPAGPPLVGGVDAEMQAGDGKLPSRGSMQPVDGAQAAAAPNNGRLERKSAEPVDLSQWDGRDDPDDDEPGGGDHRRVTNKRRPMGLQGRTDDDIPVAYESGSSFGSEADSAAEAAAKAALAAEERTQKRPAQLKSRLSASGSAGMPLAPELGRAESGAGLPPLHRQGSVKVEPQAPAAVLTLVSSEAASKGQRLTDSSDLSRLAPPSLSCVSMTRPSNTQLPQIGGAKSQPLPLPGQQRHNRYDDIELSDDEDDGPQGFDLMRWRKFYQWNKNKHADLLEFLWRRFDPRHHSMFCMTYKPQDLIFAGFQGDNVVHGFCCRLEATPVEAFGSFVTLANLQNTSFKVLGVLIVAGVTIPAAIASLPDFEQFQAAKADTRDPLVRDFIGNLLVGKSPVNELTVVSAQVVSK